MTRPELRRLNKIIASIEQLHRDTYDSVAAGELGCVRIDLLKLYNSAKLACDATEGA